MNFEEALSNHLNLHKSIELQDVVKFAYQAAKGAEHLLKDMEFARVYFDSEYESISDSEYSDDIPLYEPLSEEVARVNFHAWKERNYSKESLFDLFSHSSKLSNDSDTKLLQYLQTAKRIVQEIRPEFSTEEISNYFEEYIRSGMPALHHSEAYRISEKPAYRIVSVRLLNEYLNRIE